MCDWLDEHYRVLGAPWVTRAYQREMAEAIVDPEIPQVTFFKSSRLGYTKMLVGIVAYWIANDPKRVLIVQPTQPDYEGFSKEDLQPGLDDCGAISHLIRPRTREGDNTTALKKFPGGWIRCGGSHTGRTFRRIEPDVAIGDEVDGWPHSAGEDGDQISLMRRRLQSVHWPKLLLGSTPLDKGTSRIEREFWLSDQRYYFVPCPHCDHGQRLRFGGPDVDYGLKFSTESEEDARRTAYFLCEHCHQEIWHHKHQAEVIEHGQFIAGHLDGQGEWQPGSDVEGHAGFHLWAAYSPDPSVSWGEIAAEFVRVRRDPATLKVFTNTVLGETWELRGSSPDVGALFARRESFPSVEIPSAEPNAKPERVLMVPRGGVVLTSASDIHPDRIEAGVEAWGYGQENWKLEYRVFYGDPTALPIWEAYWEWLRQPRHLERGGVDYIRSTCIDSGYAAQSVADFVRPRQIYRTPDRKLGYLWAVKGSAGPGPIWPQRPTQSAHKCPLFIVNVNSAKDTLSQRGKIWDPESPSGPGVIHWPKDPMFGEVYFAHYGAEHRTLHTLRTGQTQGLWEKKSGHDRNEEWDVAVYNLAAISAMIVMGMDLDGAALRMAKADSPDASPIAPRSAAAPSPAPQQVSRPAKKRRRTSNAFR